MQPGAGGGAERGNGVRSLRVQRGLGARTVSGKTHSVIGVSANTQGGAEDWTDDFDLAPAAAKKTPDPAPHSPLTAAFLRIAQGENEAPRARHNRASVTTTTARKSSATAASAAPASSSTTEQSALRESKSSHASRVPAQHASAAAFGASAVGLRNVRASTNANNSNPSAATASTSSSSRRHRKDSSHHHHREDGARDNNNCGEQHGSSRRDHGESHHGHSSIFSRRRDPEDGSNLRSSGTRPSSTRKPREEPSHPFRAHRASRAEESRSPQQSSLRQKGGDEWVGEVDKAVPKRRRSRDEKHLSGSFGSRSHTSSASERKKDAGAGESDVAVWSRGQGRGEKPTSREREELMEAVNDSPTDSEALPAPQMRALGTTKLFSANDRVRAFSFSVALHYVLSEDSGVGIIRACFCAEIYRTGRGSCITAGSSSFDWPWPPVRDTYVRVCADQTKPPRYTVCCCISCVWVRALAMRENSRVPRLCRTSLNYEEI